VTSQGRGFADVGLGRGADSDRERRPWSDLMAWPRLGSSCSAQGQKPFRAVGAATGRACRSLTKETRCPGGQSQGAETGSRPSAHSNRTAADEVNEFRLPGTLPKTRQAAAGGARCERQSAGRRRADAAAAEGLAQDCDQPAKCRQ